MIRIKEIDINERVGVRRHINVGPIQSFVGRLDHEGWLAPYPDAIDRVRISFGQTANSGGSWRNIGRNIRPVFSTICGSIKRSIERSTQSNIDIHEFDAA